MPYTPTWNNPYFPQTTAPLGYSVTNQFPQTQPYQQPVDGIVKVNGRESAMQYQLPPNSMSPALFDKNGQVFYIVSTDGTGTKSIEVFDFSPHKDEPAFSIDGAQFVSRREFDEFAAKVNAVLEANHGLYATIPAAAVPQPADGIAPNDAQGGRVGAAQQPSSD